MYQHSPLKWAGSKYLCLDKIFKTVPRTGNVLVEPFVGSATVALNTNYKHYILCDLNKDLISLYKFIVLDVEALINDTLKLFVKENTEKAAYYSLRDRFNSSTDAWERATLFLYLNRHCFNGLMRYNKGKGEFNTSAGDYRNPALATDALRVFSAKFKNADFRCGHFEDFSIDSRRSSQIYCDPPYVPNSPTASFAAYTSSGFYPEDHKRLDRCATTWAKKKTVEVAISNSDTLLTSELYKGHKNSTHFDVRRVISCNGAERKKAPEILMTY